MKTEKLELYLQSLWRVSAKYIFMVVFSQLQQTHYFKAVKIVDIYDANTANNRITSTQVVKNCQLEMWANAQRDGRPAEYRWRPLFNAAVWLTPTTRVPCSNAAKTRNTLKFAWVPQTRQRPSAVSRPKFTILWGHMEEASLFITFFPIIETCLSCKDTARQSCAMVPKWRFFASCIISEPRAAHFRHAF